MAGVAPSAGFFVEHIGGQFLDIFWGERRKMQ